MIFIYFDFFYIFIFRLCSTDRHKLYQCLEAQIRLFVVELRLSLLKNFGKGSQNLLESLIEYYSRLCRASNKTSVFLQEFESRHLRRYNLTWEFLNRRLFQSTVYSDASIKNGLAKYDINYLLKFVSLLLKLVLRIFS